jgi:hypothetical protein
MRRIDSHRTAYVPEQFRTMTQWSREGVETPGPVVGWLSADLTICRVRAETKIDESRERKECDLCASSG